MSTIGSSRICKSLIIALASVTVLLGVHVMLSAQQSTPASPEAHKQVGVTVKPPPQPGWTLAASEPNETRFERRSASDPAIAGARTLATAVFGEGGELWVRMEAWKERQLAASGRKRDSIHFNRVRFKGLPCLQYDGIFADQSTSPALAYLNVKGYLCPVSDKEQLVVELEVSILANQRGFSENFLSTTDAFFDSATFSPVK